MIIRFLVIRWEIKIKDAPEYKKGRFDTTEILINVAYKCVMLCSRSQCIKSSHGNIDLSNIKH